MQTTRRGETDSVRRNQALWAQPETQLSALVLAVVLTLSLVGLLDGLEVKTIDFRFLRRATPPPANNVVVVAISEDCLANLGKFPWPRDTHARLVQRLASAGARVIAFDVLFFEAAERDPQGDHAFIEACRSFGRVVLPLHAQPLRFLDTSSGVVSHETEIVGPFPALASTAIAMGFVNADYEGLNPDGIVRRIPPRVTGPQGSAPAFAVAVAQAALGVSLATTSEALQLGSTTVPITQVARLESSDGALRLASRDAIMVNYLGGATSGAIPMVTYYEVLTGAIPASFLAGKVVIVGPTAAGLGDTKLTPHGEMPGVLIHANLAQNILRTSFITTPGPLAETLLLVVVALLTLTIVAQTGSAFRGLLALVLLVGYEMLATALFVGGAVIVPMVAPAALLVVQFVGCRFLQLVTGLQERSRDLESANNRLDQQVRDLSTLNETGGRFAMSLDLEQLAPSVLRAFMRLSAAEAGAIVTVDPDSERFVVTTVCNDADSQYNGDSIDHQRIEQALAGGAAQQALAELTSTAVPIVNTKDSIFNTYVPLPHGSQLWGVALLRCPQPEATFGANRTQFWATLGRMAATALENAKLYNLATVDSLTRLFVRRYFQLQLEQEFRRFRRYKSPFSLIMTDIDHFKACNDTYGHQQGDAVLREVAAVIKRVVRNMDIACRYGGEEFGIILPETGSEGAGILAERIRAAVEAHRIPRLGNAPTEAIAVTISIGVASVPANGPNGPDDLVGLADACLYEAKKSGRNRAITSKAGLDHSTTRV